MVRPEVQGPVVLAWEPEADNNRPKDLDKTYIHWIDADHWLFHPRRSICEIGQTLALTAQATVFIGVDSGPAKLAGGIGTPAIVLWRILHPVQFYGVCPNVLHLVPTWHPQLLQGSPARPGLQFFREHYRWRPYVDPVAGVAEALDECVC